jgi:hypothetical protein
VRHRCLVLAAALLVPATLQAQYRPQPRNAAPPPPPAPRTVFETLLGGDSAQATMVQLRRHKTYRVEFSPAAAELTIRPRTSAGGVEPPVDTLVTNLADTVAGRRTYRIRAGEGGPYLVELTNTQVGATALRISEVPRMRGDTLPRAFDPYATVRRRVDPSERSSFMPLVIAVAVPVMLLQSLLH